MTCEKSDVPVLCCSSCQYLAQIHEHPSFCAHCHVRKNTYSLYIDMIFNLLRSLFVCSIAVYVINISSDFIYCFHQKYIRWSKIFSAFPQLVQELLNHQAHVAILTL